MNKKIIGLSIFPVLVVLFASLFASSHPDALESVAITHGFDEKAKETSSFFTDYTLGFINNEFMSTFLAGIIGLALLYLIYKIINLAVTHYVKNMKIGS